MCLCAPPLPRNVSLTPSPLLPTFIPVLFASSAQVVGSAGLSVFRQIDIDRLGKVREPSRPAPVITAA